MYLICFGTRPELIKLIPLIQKFKEKKIKKNFIILQNKINKINKINK